MNGMLSNSIQLQCSIQQDCALDAYLYVIVVDSLDYLLEDYYQIQQAQHI